MGAGLAREEPVCGRMRRPRTPQEPAGSRAVAQIVRRAHVLAPGGCTSEVTRTRARAGFTLTP